MILFNKELDITVEEFNSIYSLYASLELTEWIYESAMTEKEKLDNESYKTTGWFLRERSFEDACKLWWNKADDGEKNRFLTLPWFDASIFEEITGIKVNEEIEEMTME